ncbi:MAG: AAA family ATPase [Ktedonobacteraceae bacterium]
MRITVRNLGVLKEATIDLKPLTIFIGPNNTGKTWLAYALAGIFGSYGSEKYIQAYIEKQVPLIYETLDQAVERVLAEGNATIDLSKFSQEYGETYFSEVAKYAHAWMDTFLDTQFSRFDSLEISLRLTEAKLQFLTNIEYYSRRNDIGPRGSLLTIRKLYGDDKIFVYTSSETQNAEKPEEQLGAQIPLEEVRERLVNFVFTALRQCLYFQVHVFPTEKAFLVTGRLNTMTDRVVQQNSGTLPTPVKDFENMLDIMLKSGTREKKAREISTRNDVMVKQYIDFAEVLEKQILEGSIDFSTPEPDPRREILFKPSQDVSLEISIASSMAKELSSLVLYLRLLAQPKELLIIDEPEMNLHPEAQAKMIEFLAMLVNAGLRVLITTHSPYIVDHLSNMIKATEYDGDDRIAIADKFFLKRKDAFISQDDVAVYLFNPPKVESILQEEGKINWSTFGDVTDQVASIHYDL